MPFFAKARLEGRALEHELAKQRGLAIRMFDGVANEWVLVQGAEAREIRLEMRARAKELTAALAAEGLLVQAADRPVVVGGVRKSVDLRVWSTADGAEALVEVKWSRGLLSQALLKAEESLPWLKQACGEGRWFQAKYNKLG